MKRKKGIKGVLESIPFINANFNTNLIKTGKDIYSITLEFNDINYQIMKEEDQLEIFDRYSKLLNYFSDDLIIQLSINNRKTDINIVEDKISVPLRNDEFDEIREDYNKIIIEGLKKGKGDMKKELLLTISLKANSYDNAYDMLEKVIKDIENEFKMLGSSLKILSIEERLEIMHDIMNFNEIGKFNRDEIIRDKKDGLTSKNCIAPTYMEFNLSHYIINERYYRGLFIKTYADTLDDQFIDEILASNLDISVSINLKPLDKAKALEIVRANKSASEVELYDRRKKAIKNKQLDVMIPEELQENLDTTKELLENLKKNSDKMFYTTITIIHGAEDKKILDEDTKTLMRIASKHDIKLGTLTLQQEECFQCSLPLAICDLSCGRLLTTSEVAIFMPFGVQELLHSHGLYYGKNSCSKNTLMLDRRKFDAGHGAILGKTGSGKSVCRKFEMASVALTTDEEILCIDPLGEDDDLIKKLGGEVIKISVDSNNYINPFDFGENYGNGKGILLKAEFLISFFDKLLGGHSGLSSAEKSIIDRCITEVYRPYIASGYDKDKIPTMRDFQDVLESQTEKEAKALATSLEIYAKGSLSVFANKTNVDINNRIISYNLKDLGESLQEIAYLVVLDNIMNRLSYNQTKGIESRLYADEFHLLTTSKLATEFFVKMYKTARHMFCIITIATQQVSNLLENDKIASTIANSDFLQILNQNSQERNKITKMLNLSKSQLSYIKAAKVGTGLLVLNENTIIPFENTLNTKSKIYNLIRTDNRIKEVK